MFIFLNYFNAGEKCQVKDPRNGYVFDLKPLSGQDYEVNEGEYKYHISVCSPLKAEVCAGKTPEGVDPVSSCQVKPGSGGFQKVAGKLFFVFFAFLKMFVLQSF